VRSADTHRPGARVVELRDWPFGAVGRRLLLEALLLDSQPADGWTRQMLEERVDVTNGGLEKLLAGAVDLGLATVAEGRVAQAQALPPIAPPLMDVLRIAQGLPHRPAHPLPRRPYQQSG
jgi:hypothetical protein